MSCLQQLCSAASNEQIILNHKQKFFLVSLLDFCLGLLIVSVDFLLQLNRNIIVSISCFDSRFDIVVLYGSLIGVYVHTFQDDIEVLKMKVERSEIQRGLILV